MTWRAGVPLPPSRLRLRHARGLGLRVRTFWRPCASSVAPLCLGRRQVPRGAVSACPHPTDLCHGVSPCLPTTATRAGLLSASGPLDIDECSLGTSTSCPRVQGTLGKELFLTRPPTEALRHQHGPHLLQQLEVLSSSSSFLLLLGEGPGGSSCLPWAAPSHPKGGSLQSPKPTHDHAAPGDPLLSSPASPRSAVEDLLRDSSAMLLACRAGSCPLPPRGQVALCVLSLVSPPRGPSFLGVQVTWLPCDPSSLMGSRHVIL